QVVDLFEATVELLDICLQTTIGSFRTLHRHEERLQIVKVRILRPCLCLALLEVHDRSLKLVACLIQRARRSEALDRPSLSERFADLRLLMLSLRRTISSEHVHEREAKGCNLVTRHRTPRPTVRAPDRRAARWGDRRRDADRQSRPNLGIEPGGTRHRPDRRRGAARRHSAAGSSSSWSAPPYRACGP